MAEGHTSGFENWFLDKYNGEIPEGTLLYDALSYATHGESGRFDVLKEVADLSCVTGDDVEELKNIVDLAIATKSEVQWIKLRSMLKEFRMRFGDTLYIPEHGFSIFEYKPEAKIDLSVKRTLMKVEKVLHFIDECDLSDYGTVSSTPTYRPKPNSQPKQKKKKKKQKKVSQVPDRGSEGQNLSVTDTSPPTGEVPSSVGDQGSASGNKKDFPRGDGVVLPKIDTGEKENSSAVSPRQQDREQEVPQKPQSEQSSEEFWPESLEDILGVVEGLVQQEKDLIHWCVSSPEEVFTRNDLSEGIDIGLHSVSKLIISINKKYRDTLGRDLILEVKDGFLFSMKAWMAEDEVEEDHESSDDSQKAEYEKQLTLFMSTFGVTPERYDFLCEIVECFIKGEHYSYKNISEKETPAFIRKVSDLLGPISNTARTKFGNRSFIVWDKTKKELYFIRPERGSRLRDMFDAFVKSVEKKDQHDQKFLTVKKEKKVGLDLNASLLSEDQNNLLKVAELITWAPSEKRLLSDFLQYSGRSWTKEKICERADVTESSFPAILTRIRKKLKDAGYKGILPGATSGKNPQYSFGKTVASGVDKPAVIEDDVSEKWEVASPDILERFSAIDWGEHFDTVEGIIAYFDFYRGEGKTIDDLGSEVDFEEDNVVVEEFIDWINQAWNENYEEPLIYQNGQEYWIYPSEDKQSASELVACLGGKAQEFLAYYEEADGVVSRSNVAEALGIKIGTVPTSMKRINEILGCKVFCNVHGKGDYISDEWKALREEENFMNSEEDGSNGSDNLLGEDEIVFDDEVDLESLCGGFSVKALNKVFGSYELRESDLKLLSVLLEDNGIPRTERWLRSRGAHLVIASKEGINNAFGFDIVSINDEERYFIGEEAKEYLVALFDEED